MIGSPEAVVYVATLGVGSQYSSAELYAVAPFNAPEAASGTGGEVYPAVVLVFIFVFRVAAVPAQLATGIAIVDKSKGAVVVSMQGRLVISLELSESRILRLA